MSFRFVDLFAGIGGFRRPFEEVGGKCVFTSERDRFARQTYEANYSVADHQFAGEIQPFADDPELVPEHDLLLAGFPCQPFSAAGLAKKKFRGDPDGFDCEVSGNAFFQLAQIIDHHRPAAFLLENVKGILWHEKGRTMEVIMGVLRDMGYQVGCRVIDSSPWVPQKRERVFFTGFLECSGFRFDHLNIPDNKPVLADIMESDPDPKYTLSDTTWYRKKRERQKQNDKGNYFGYRIYSPHDVAATLTSRYDADMLLYQESGNPRKFTPREYCRLMGFDRPGESSFKIQVSDTQAYRQFGNAVVVPVVRAIAEIMVPHLHAESLQYNQGNAKTR